jgi:hypothetical protein
MTWEMMPAEILSKCIASFRGGGKHAHLYDFCYYGQRTHFSAFIWAPTWQEISFNGNKELSFKLY